MQKSCERLFDIYLKAGQSENERKPRGLLGGRDVHGNTLSKISSVVVLQLIDACTLNSRVTGLYEMYESNQIKVNKQLGFNVARSDDSWFFQKVGSDLQPKDGGSRHVFTCTLRPKSKCIARAGSCGRDPQAASHGGRSNER